MQLTRKGGTDFEVQVRVTWEAQDMTRLVNEAVKEGITRLAGGDGTVNEAVSAIHLVLPEDCPCVGTTG